ncbi:hypothetical protein V6Z77_004276, partial [Aspergillus fumigatus]
RVYAAALSILPSAFIHSLFCSYFATHPFISLNPCGCGRRLQTDATDVLTTLVANGTCPAQNEGAYIFSNCPRIQVYTAIGPELIAGGVLLVRLRKVKVSERPPRELRTRIKTYGGTSNVAHPTPRYLSFTLGATRRINTDLDVPHRINQALSK